MQARTIKCERPLSKAARLEKTMELAISINEAARRAGVGRSSIYEAAKRGEISIKKRGRKSLILVSDLANWVNSLPEATTLKAA